MRVIKRINYNIIKLLFLFIKDGKTKSRILKKHKFFHLYGNDNYWYSKKLPTEPFLISIGNNVVIAADVKMFTHDAINDMLTAKTGKHYPYYMGKIEIGNNVFVGANSIIVPNTKIGNNVIIAAGSVIVKDVADNSIVGGNPAKVIGKVSEFEKKRLINSENMPSSKSNMDIINNYFWKGE